MFFIHNIQHILNYEGCEGIHYKGNRGLGKIGTTGFLVGIVCGFHLSIVCITSVLLVANAVNMDWEPLLSLILHWSLYGSMLCFFHFAEFFVTSVYQPQTLTYDCKLFIQSNSIQLKTPLHEIHMSCVILFSVHCKSQHGVYDSCANEYF